MFVSYVLVRNSPLLLHIFIGIVKDAVHSFNSCITLDNSSYPCISNSELEAIVIEWAISNDKECFGCMH